jgi:hypothetical protein
MIIAVDFDGTLCEYAGNFPVIGEPNIPLIDIPLIDLLKEARSKGHEVVLWTCREEAYLEEALLFCKSHGLEFDAVNENAPGSKLKIANGTAKRKIYANLYIDDKSTVPSEAYLYVYKHLGKL